MSFVDVRLTGFKETLHKFDMIKALMPDINDTSIISILELGQNVAQAIVPVRTGFLQRSIGYTVTGINTGKLEATAFYAARINYGDSKIQARPFFDLAVQEMAAQFQSVVLRETELALTTQDPHVLNLKASRAYESMIRKTHGVTAKHHQKSLQRLSTTSSPFGTTRSNYARKRPGQQHIGARFGRHKARGSVGGRKVLH